ncbi:MAG: zinc ribbon domain-containing protein [Planctomycetaceae bacterium]|jgi:hypothetical protein|nr:zinc ribbon domain-containing protein [Planctomycetaceae bacterium]
MNCSHCGNVLPDQAIYCPQCGTRVKPDVSNSNRVDVRVFVEEVLRTQKCNSISSCLSRSWTLVCSDYWTFFITTLVATLCMSIPVIGFIILGGVSYYYLGKIRNQHRKLGDIFVGFRRQTLQLILAGLVQITVVALYILAGVFGIYIILANTLGGIDAFVCLLLILIGFVFCIPVTCLAVSWLFTFHLIVDYNLQFWNAMEISRRVICLPRILVLLNVFLLLGMFSYVGILFVLPFWWAALSYTYEDIFGGVSLKNNLPVMV